MEQEKTTCPICGKQFQKKMSRQKYCSPACGRYANRHNKVTHSENPDAEVIRTFTCRRCGDLVRVTDPMDKRLKFCSQYCEKLFWKHPEKAEALVVERTFVCRGCGKTVKVTSAFDRRHIFCSKKCQQKYVVKMNKKAHGKAQATKKDMTKSGFTCKGCGTYVEVEGKPDARRLYCSVECRKRHTLRVIKLRKTKSEKGE